MRVLSVPEFYSWIQDKNPESFVFSTENNRFMKNYGIMVVERFQKLLPSASLDRLCFQNSSGGILCLEQVREVHMFDNTESIGVVFDAVCATAYGTSVWRLIAD